jgi:glucose-6-phosphate 1-epimerase
MLYIQMSQYYLLLSVCGESSVVWNPCNKKAKALPDLGDDDYKMMQCVNSAAIDIPILLKPCEERKGYQELSTVSSSYCSGQLDPQSSLWLSLNYN